MTVNMSTYRIYVDSRERKSGTATEFEYALPYTLNIREKSRASVDVVVVPNSIKTVSARNDIIYVQETATIGDTQEVRDRLVYIPEGYYTVETLRVAVQTALNGPSKFLPGAYVVEYNELMARFQYSNDATRFNDSFEIFTKESLENRTSQPVILTL